MDKELKEKWIKALRNDKYKQGKYRLRASAENFCCLGVLADVYDSCGWRMNGAGTYTWCHLHEASLPNALLPDSAQKVLVSLNDQRCYTFYEIADWVEENL